MLRIVQNHISVVLVLIALSQLALSIDSTWETSVEDETHKDESQCGICKKEMARSLQIIDKLKMAVQKAEERAEKVEKELHELVSGTKITHDEKSGIYSSTTCEGKTAQISCPHGKVLHIQEADYGRKDRQTCKHTAMQDTKCSAKKSFLVVNKKCAALESCEMEATNTEFTDPCVGTYKYLTISYKCAEKVVEEFVED